MKMFRHLLLAEWNTIGVMSEGNCSQLPSAAAAADLTSGLSSFSALSASLVALASFGIRPKTRMAVARSLVLSPVHALSSICQACSFGGSAALERDRAAAQAHSSAAAS